MPLKDLLVLQSKYTVIIAVSLVFASVNAFAAIPGLPNLPGSTEAGLVGKTIPRKTFTPAALKPLSPKEVKATNTLGPQAAKIHFPLKKVILQGNTVYSDEVLSALYKDKMNKTISVTELQDITQAITNFYRNNGYILSRAILPPQHIQHGVVTIRVVEGYIDKVEIIGTPGRARYLLAAYGNKIRQSRPLQLKVLERYLFLANEIPGVTAQAVLGPSPSLTDGVSDLNLVSNVQPANMYISYDNFQSRYNGPKEATISINFNNNFRSGDTTHLIYLTGTTPRELQFFDLSYDTPLGAEGAHMQIGGNKSITKPEFILTPLQLVGVARIYYANFYYPQLRSRSANLTWDAGIIYYNTNQDILKHIPLYEDVIRTIDFGGVYDFYDRFNGSNSFTLHAYKGLPIAGATTNQRSIHTSRFGATANFLKFIGQFTRNQQLFGPFTFYGTIQFQEVFVPMLAYEQFGFGGPFIGRGYDPSELLGDKGAAGSFELRYNGNPGWAYLKSAQGFMFYDIGKIWNLKNVPGTKINQSASSAGVGIRITFGKYLSGTWTIAQPLTRQEQTMAILGRGRAPRVLFSITGAV